jgi:hypothetical protein
MQDPRWWHGALDASFLCVGAPRLESGRIEFTTVGGVTANYVSHRCARQATAQFGEASALIVETKTYDTVDAARADLTFTRAIGNATDTPSVLAGTPIWPSAARREG